MQTIFLILADLAYRRGNLEHAAASLPNLVSGCLLTLLLSLILLASYGPDFALGWIHPATPILLFVYISGLILTRRSRQTPMWRAVDTAETQHEKDKEPSDKEGATGSLLLRLSVLAVIVSGAGYAISTSGMELAGRTGLDSGLIGALLTSTVTSTPELVTTLAAVRRGAVTLAVGGIFGGNTFDVLFVAFSDLAYRPGSIYHALDSRDAFLISLTLAMTAVLLIGLLLRERRGPANIGFEGVTVLLLYGCGVAIMIFGF